MNANVFAPGARVTCSYRRNDATGVVHAGTVLAIDDPRAWAGTLAFFGPEFPDARKVRAHVERCIAEFQDFCDKVPVFWSFGTIYWEPARALVPFGSSAQEFSCGKAVGT
jgi:hypothetical protein